MGMMLKLKRSSVWGTFRKGWGAGCERRSGIGRERNCLMENLKALKCHFQHSLAESCVNKVPKIDHYDFLLNLTKKSVVIRCNLFS